MKRVNVYIDYSNVYKGARDAYAVRPEPGYFGNIRPYDLGSLVALKAPDGTSRASTHVLGAVKVFRGAPDPAKQPLDAEIERLRAQAWEDAGCRVYRHALDYARGSVVEKGVDVRLAVTMVVDACQGRMDHAIVVSADKDYRYALLQVRDLGAVEVETSIWLARPGGRSIGRIELRPERPGEDEAGFVALSERDFGQLRDTTNYYKQARANLDRS